MRKSLITAAALMLAATAIAAIATAASATTLLKVGGIFPDHGRDLGGYDSCSLDDGSRLTVVTFEAQGAAREIRLEHIWPDGSLDAPAFTLAVGNLTDPQIACGTGGNAIVSWRRSEEWCIRYRVVDSDHRHASEVREAAPGGNCNIAPAFSVTDDGYAIAWLAEHPGARDDVWVQGYDHDGAARYAPALLSTDPTHWHSWPAVGTDSEGNTVVAWEEGNDVFREMVAAAVTADGEPSDVPLPVLDQETDAALEASPYRVVAQSPGIFSVYWSAPVAGGLIGQTVAIAEVATQTTTTSTTTSTTLDDDETPVFGGTRDWNREELSNWSIEPRLAGDGHGAWLAMWTGTEGTTRWNRKHFRLASVSNDSGRRWSRPIRQEGSPSQTLSDGSGEWIAIGQDNVYGDHGWSNEIQLSLSTGSGTAWLSPRKIATVPEPGDDDCYAEVNALAAGRSRSGALAVVWAESTYCDFAGTEWQWSDLYVIRSTDNGVNWTLSSLLISRDWADSTDNIGSVQLVAVGSNGWLLVYGGGSYQAIRSVDDAASWSEPQPFAGNPAALVCDSADHCVLASSGAMPKFGPDGDVFANVSDDAGLTWTFAGPINSNALIDRTVDRSPVIATDDHGRWTAVWVSHHDLGGRIGLDADLLESISIDGGRTWSPPRVVSELAASDGWLTDDEPQLGYGAGAWVALWETVTPTTEYLKRCQARVIVADDGCGDGVVAGFEECDDGNVADGDGCDRNCYATACGNGIQTAGEECDDGNDLDDDDCTPDCRVAFCGDGHVRTVLEECDDANSNDADACTNDCTAARCGDGIVAEGIEQCDDGNTSNEDACTNHCTVARCGDGYVEDEVEDCDDMNQDDGDGCRSDCSGARCGDANGDGEVTATDSMGILLHAVGLPTPCPIQSCDIDGDFRIRSRDALMALGMSVGLSYPASCNLGPWVIIRLQDERAVGALLVRANTSAAPLSFPVDGDGVPACEPFRSDVMLAAHVNGKDLLLGMVTRGELRGPADVARCRVEVTGDVHPSQFAVTIEDATDADGIPLNPSPVVVLRAVGY